MRLGVTLKNYRCFGDDRPAQFEIGPGLTALVGPNNSGKSTLLRLFHDYRGLWQLLRDPNTYVGAWRAPHAWPIQEAVRDPHELFTHATPRDQELTLVFHDRRPGRLQTLAALTIVLLRGTDTFRLMLPQELTAYDPRHLTARGSEIHVSGSPALDVSPAVEAATALLKTTYFGPFRNLLDNRSQEYYGIPIGTQFIANWKGAEGGYNHNEIRRLRRLTSDLREIFGFGELSISTSGDGSTLKLMIDGQHFTLPEVGAGLAQFIVILGTLSTGPRRSFVLIDEPEMNLHPRLQVRLLQAIHGLVDVGVLFSTHSIGLARAMGTTVYSIVPQATGSPRIAPLAATRELVQFLGEMQYSQWAELGFQKVLLVEGPTDVLVAHELLRRVGKDAQYVVLHLGGDSSVNAHAGPYLQELLRVSPHVHCLIDSERDRPQAALSAGREAFVNVCGQFGVKCHVLERRAIENYWSERALKVLLGEKAVALDPYQPLKAAVVGWPKADNWKCAYRMTEDEFAGTDLWAFFQSL